MATVLTSSQQTFVDITDQRKLSAYITSSLPKTQTEDPNVLPHVYAPSWAKTNLVLTPVVFLDQSSVALGSTGLTINWKRKDGTSAETSLTSGETVADGILTVKQDKLAASESGMLTYICYISYYDSETKNTVNISSDITYTLVKNAENARLAYLTSDTYVFKYDSGSALVGAKQATLTAQVQGVTISKWQYKNSAGNWVDYPTTSDNANITSGTNGTSAVVFSVYAPNGTVVQNQSGSLTLATSAYSGTTAITNATYQWARYTNGTWSNISGATGATLTVSGTDIVNIQSYRCTMTYGGKSYVDVITVEDKSDPYVSEMLSIGGFTVKNNMGGVIPYVIVRTNQKEVDELLGPISETAPASPKAGAFWYQINHTAKTVTLMKYSGSSWAAATEKQSMTYTWYAQDKDGNETTFGKTGKVIYLSAADIDSILTLQCDVSN